MYMYIPVCVCIYVCVMLASHSCVHVQLCIYCCYWMVGILQVHLYRGLATGIHFSANMTISGGNDHTHVQLELLHSVQAVCALFIARCVVFAQLCHLL